MLVRCIGHAKFSLSVPERVSDFHSNFIAVFSVSLLVTLMKLDYESPIQSQKNHLCCNSKLVFLHTFNKDDQILEMVQWRFTGMVSRMKYLNHVEKLGLFSIAQGKGRFDMSVQNHEGF